MSSTPQCTIETQPMLSPQEMQERLDGIREHVEKADQWARKHFALFPQVDMVSVNFGATFFLSFSVTLTWKRGI